MSNDRPEFMEDPDRLGRLCAFLDSVGYSVIKRKHMYQAYDFLKSNWEMLSDAEQQYWEANKDDIEELAKISRESRKNDPPPEELEEKAKERSKKEREENE